MMVVVYLSDIPPLGIELSLMECFDWAIDDGGSLSF